MLPIGVCLSEIKWKRIRITRDADRGVRKAIGGYDFDKDDFISYVLEECDIDRWAEKYGAEVEEEEEEEEDED